MLYLPLTATEQSYKIIGTDNEKNNFFHLIDPLNHSYPRTFYVHRIKKLADLLKVSFFLCRFLRQYNVF